MERQTNIENAGVFELITQLCSQNASKYCTHSRISHKKLTSKMRSQAYGIILRKTSINTPRSMGEPIADLLSYYYVAQKNAKNIAEYKKSQELKSVISTIRKSDFGGNKDHIYTVLRLLVALSDSVSEDLSFEIFQKPFTFGLLDEMLPKMPRQAFGSPQPYPYYPSHVFELPFSLKKLGNSLDLNISQTYTEYTVESFDSKVYSVDTANSQGAELKTFLSPMSLASMTSTHLSPYSENSMSNYPRLTAPRDLQIPRSQTLGYDSNLKPLQSVVNSQTEEVHEMFRADSSTERDVDIWELASRIDNNLPDDIWEIVAKMPFINERQLIATSSREIRLWRTIYRDVMAELTIISERQFIRHIMYLTIGIETSSFPYNAVLNCFFMKDNLVLEGVSKENLRGYVGDLLLIGTFYKRLYNFAFNQTLEDHCHTNGLVYEAAREAIRKYLLNFQLKATEIYEECCKCSAEYINLMPTLLQILYHMEPLKYEIETVCSIYKIIDTNSKNKLPYGAELMSYLFNEMSLVTHKGTSFAMFTQLFSICKVYFKFIEKFIFEGELDDRFNEFFIRKDSQHVNCRSKRYWDKGFHITQSMAVPEFLRAIAKFILLCGKSLRLLKLCNPNDPLVLLISSDHPSVKCCTSFDELERQQQLLDVYRTRCLFVSGELVTFDQILLKKEAERKAFTEMATLKQAETMEKIVAERKRLAQLIIAEKQHSLRVLEAAMAEAKAAKLKSKQRERKRYEIEAAGDKATEEVDSMLREVEKNKIMEYYSKLNIEVERKQMHTEWKIKRLQLDQSRMQLLSTEERNLKREKLELEHQRNEEMTKSMLQDDNDKKEEINDAPSENELSQESQLKLPETDKMTDSTNSVVMLDVEEKSTDTEFDANKKSSQSSTDVFSAICNVAKNFFGGSKSDRNVCDNVKQLDSQGNIIVSEYNSNITKCSSDVIGSHLRNYDNDQFLRIKHKALLNKQKVMAHEFGQDLDNNPKNPHSMNLASYDKENNVEEWSPYLEAKAKKLNVLGDEFGLQPNAPIVHEPITEAQKEALVNKHKILGDEFGLPPDAFIGNTPITDAQKEAVINKLRILGDEFGLPSNAHIIHEPITDAQKEAVINKQRILGDEFGLPPDVPIIYVPTTVASKEALINKLKILGDGFGLKPDDIFKREPTTIAQKEALINKLKILGDGFGLKPDDIFIREPTTVAQKEALINKLKILGDGFGLKPDDLLIHEPTTVAQKEALINKLKILGDGFGLKPDDIFIHEPTTVAQREALINKLKILGDGFGLKPDDLLLHEPSGDAQKEAVINKLKILGDGFGLKPVSPIINEPKTDAQKEALVNKQKILGVEYNLSAEAYINKEPENIAQEEALRNKKKALTSEYGTRCEQIAQDSHRQMKRSELTLNLKPYGEAYSTGTTPNAAVTPGEIFPRLDLETPTTAEVPLESAMTADIFTPRSDYKSIEIDRKTDKDFLTADGFNFPILDDTVDSELANDVQTEPSPDNSPTKSSDITQMKSRKSHSVFNILDGSYSLKEFDPFGVKELKSFSKDHFINKMDLEMSTSCYTHPALIMEEVQKRPYSNIFTSNFDLEIEEEQKVTCDNIATLTACLQRSVMLPLTYQMEVVNNSILTYFLVDLDMYEHLKSLKDYFFLMDGEFSRSICHNLFTKLTKTLNPQELLNFATLHNILDKALGSSISHVHKFSENLSFTIADTPLSFQHSSPDVLQCLSLTYTVTWPLNIILSQEALLRYAKVFQFLLKMRRIFWVLGEDFQNLKLAAKLSKRHSRKLLKSPQYISVQIYRHIMASMIRALDNYIVTTCILTSWTEFENDLKKARTLDDLYECHVAYIKKVLFRCLLNNRSTPVMKLLNDIFTVILKFSRVLKAGEWQQKEPNGTFTHSSFPQLQELFHLFEKLAKYLHKVVTKLMECGYQRHLVELLTMVNLNGYYDPERSREENNATGK